MPRITTSALVLALVAGLFFPGCSGDEDDEFVVGGLTFEANGSGCKLLRDSDATAGAVTIPATVEGMTVNEIASGAFQLNAAITSVVIPDGVLAIGSSAFYGCTSLQSVTLPAKLASIGYVSFFGCSALARAAVSGSSAAGLELPASVTSLDLQSFMGCSSLTRLGLSSALTTIPQNCFNGCAGLTSLGVPEGVAALADNAFDGCSGLTAIDLPATLTSAGVCAFYNCAKLESVTCRAANPPAILPSTFAACDAVAAVYVPSASETAYESAEVWKTFGPTFIQAIAP